MNETHKNSDSFWKISFFVPRHLCFGFTMRNRIFALAVGLMSTLSLYPSLLCRRRRRHYNLVIIIINIVKLRAECNRICTYFSSMCISFYISCSLNFLIFFFPCVWYFLCVLFALPLSSPFLSQIMVVATILPLFLSKNGICILYCVAAGLLSLSLVLSFYISVKTLI